MVTVKLGDTRFPASHGAIGSSTMSNAGGSVLLAAKAACNKAIDLALMHRFAVRPPTKCSSGMAR
jgi:CO/xanthine dehydrogenase Mo-binding subunit